MTKLKLPESAYASANGVINWYENYQRELGQQITKNAFAQLIGHDSFTEVRKIYSFLSDKTRADFEALEAHVKGINDRALQSTLNDHVFSLRRILTITDILRFLAAKGDISSADIREFLSFRYSDFSLSLKSIVAEIVSNKELTYDYHVVPTEPEKELIASHFLAHCNSALYEDIVTSEHILYAINERDFAAFYNNYCNTLSDKNRTIKYNTARLTFKRATEDNLADYEKVAKIIRSQKDNFELDFKCQNDLRPIFHAKDEASIIVETAVWLGNKDIAQDKVCFDFFMTHCDPENLSLERRNVLPWFEGLDTARRGSSVDISKILTSNSMIAPPVLASYLLYNIGSMEFSVERFYAILYVIQKLPVLRPFVERLEPIHRIETTRKYNNSDLQDSLSATFLLINKIKNIKNDATSYFEFMHELFAAKQYTLVIGESMRMLEMARLTGRTRLDNAVYHSVSEVDEDVLRKMPAKCLHAAYMLILRGTGHKSEKLTPLIEEPFLETYNKLENDDFQYTLIRPSTEHLEKHHEAMRFLSESLERRTYHGNPNQANQLEGLLRASTLDDTTITFEDEMFECEGRDASYFRVMRGDHQFINTHDDEVNHTPLGKLIEKLDAFGYINKNHMAFICYLNGERIRGKKWISKSKESTYAFKEGRLIAESSIDLNILFELIIKLRPCSIELVSWRDYYAYGSHNIHSINNKCHIKISVLKITDMTERFFDAFALHYDFFSKVNLSQFASYNPLQSEIKKHLPRFYFYGKEMNKEGVDY